MTRRQLSLTDHTALCFMLGKDHVFTWEVAKACGLIAGRRCLPQNRNMLRRLESWGYVTRVTAMPGGYAQWAISAAGQKAVQP